MRPPELTVEDVERLACAMADTNNAPIEQLISRAAASDVEDILIRIMVSRGYERTLLMAFARQAIASHVASCEHPSS
jgi:hypothetical protein